MRKSIKISFVLVFILSELIYSQVDSVDCCPKEFTGKRIGTPKIIFEKLVVKDSLKYSVQPKIIDSISNVIEKLNDNLLKFPNDAEGRLIVSVVIDSIGLINSCRLIVGWNEKLDSLALEVIKHLKFESAKIGKEKILSEATLFFNRIFIFSYDEPSSIVSEVTLDYQPGQVFKQWKIIIKSDLSAYFEDVWHYVQYYPADPPPKDSTFKYQGVIDMYTFKRLNSLIHSICFFTMKDEYGSQHPHGGKITLSVTLAGITKSIRIKSDEPVGLWALKKLIYCLKDNIIKWEQIN